MLRYFLFIFYLIIYSFILTFIILLMINHISFFFIFEPYNNKTFLYRVFNSTILLLRVFMKNQMSLFLLRSTMIRTDLVSYSPSGVCHTLFLPESKQVCTRNCVINTHRAIKPDSGRQTQRVRWHYMNALVKKSHYSLPR